MAIIIVPDDQPTIQQGVNAAANDDFVYVRANTYNEQVDTTGKIGVAIVCQDGTIINHAGAGAVVTLDDVCSLENCIAQGSTNNHGVVMTTGFGQRCRRVISRDNNLDGFLLNYRGQQCGKRGRPTGVHQLSCVWQRG